MSEVRHRTLEDTRVQYRTAAPTVDPEFEGETWFEDAPESGGLPASRCVRVGTETEFIVVAFVPFLYSGDPTGFVTSRCPGDQCIDTVTDMLYYARVGNTTTEWYPIGGGAGGGS
ncbi:hypothetical protein NIES2135_53300 [Leptolyngbya boryana NIES-2135]|jgi:hypothetical protein|uniref:Uncharacterized protein n=1 Tax=Leptolyngbya boryana NIES-2135 TaxID=1973484 RepID=A0A1Z4JP75_LEPBY|nr:MULTISPECIES: hypothetical protein [Leptolyngbya]BAY58457.1 hypothetical protein NIES2135_53300 [Leptolyngbya boryana NIES-2135]MBD2370930.1 hypothetical protein [Leptolyngbya sp. FACHB-161]MBD2377444.1 hypothetical protein [Leptolyngbya sp. FACHB-238]MBD2401852.1 hypothetical protein [Leptolyngbya sp. FACHB-239]MBD2408370.1 hypothetical protein [Leptolyngbya sp. FACHB-402]